MKAYWWNEGIARRILNLATRWRWVVSFRPRPLYPREEGLRYPLYRRLVWSQSLSGNLPENWSWIRNSIKRWKQPPHYAFILCNSRIN